MILQENIDDREVRKLIRARVIVLAGNKKLKIFGLLSCWSGKKMKKTNRVFFTSEEEPVQAGYRPCAHCMRQAYNTWKRTAG